MAKRFPRCASPALVVALVALFVALGGTGYAAFALPKNSVGTAQIKNRAVTETKIARKAIAVLRGNRGPRGAIGPAGPVGAQGPQGLQGPPGPTTSALAEDAPGTVDFPPGGGGTGLVAALNVSAGHYVLVAHTTIKNDNAREHTVCYLDDSTANQLDAAYVSTSVADGGYPNQESLTLMGLLTTPGSLVTIDCVSDRSDTYALASKIMAISVQSVTTRLG